jgi:hypothetical protein
MMKNTVDPMATQSGVLAALLAEKGYSGPEHVIDGKEGLAHVFKPEWKLDLLTRDLGESWRITQCGMKAFPPRSPHPYTDLGRSRSGQEQRLAAGLRRQDSGPIAGPRDRYSLRSQQVRSAHERNCGSLTALRHRRCVSRPPGFASSSGPEIGAKEKTLIPGDKLDIDFTGSTVIWRGERFVFPPLGAVPQSLVIAGGAENVVAKKLGLDRKEHPEIVGVSGD